jgi:hypothetical protein
MRTQAAGAPSTALGALRTDDDAGRIAGDLHGLAAALSPEALAGEGALPLLQEVLARLDGMRQAVGRMMEDMRSSLP